MFCALIYAMNSGINSVWVAAENGLPHWIVSPEMSLVLELTVKQQALLYITVEEQSYAQSFPSPDLKSSVCACFVWLCSSVHASVCVFVRVLPSTVYQSMRRECLQGCQRRFKIFSLLSAPTHFSLCTAAQICKSILLRMQSTRSASIYSFLLSPSQCTHPPFHSVPIPPPPTIPFLLSPLCLWFCCLVRAALFFGICTQWRIIGRWKDFFWAASSLDQHHSFSLVQNTKNVKDCHFAHTFISLCVFSLVTDCLHYVHTTIYFSLLNYQQ